jgi:hypothetical protein
MMIRSKTNDFVVTFENHGEHHMGAETVIIAVSRPIEGISHFKTTNGSAFFSSDGHGLFIHDACVILYYEITVGEVYNFLPPDNWYFTHVGIEDLVLIFDLYDGSGQTRQGIPVLLSDIKSRSTKGFGVVDNGRFPSAYP